MQKTKDTQIFHKIKRTINLLALGKPSKREISSGDLVAINAPALLGKRDALYEKAINELKKEILSLPPVERSTKYEEALLNLLAGIETGKQIFLDDNFKNKEKHIDSPLEHYMLLLADTVQTSLTLCNHQIIFELEKKNLDNFIGEKNAAQIKEKDCSFADAERKVFECVKQLIEKAEHSIKQQQELIKRSLTKDDETRYRKAFSQFLNHK